MRPGLMLLAFLLAGASANLRMDELLKETFGITEAQRDEFHRYALAHNNNTRMVMDEQPLTEEKVVVTYASNSSNVLQQFELYTISNIVEMKVAILTVKLRRPSANTERCKRVSVHVRQAENGEFGRALGKHRVRLSHLNVERKVKISLDKEKVASTIADNGELSLYVTADCNGEDLVTLSKNAANVFDRPTLTLAFTMEVRSRSKRTVKKCTEEDDECCLRDNFLSFAGIGWAFVEYPTHYNIGLCTGECLKTGHTPFTRQALLSDFSLCCATTSFGPLDMRLNIKGEIVSRRVENMRALTCGCM